MPVFLYKILMSIKPTISWFPVAQRHLLSVSDNVAMQQEGEQQENDCSSKWAAALHHRRATATATQRLSNWSIHLVAAVKHASAQDSNICTHSQPSRLRYDCKLKY